MGKLHEVLAVEASKKKGAESAIEQVTGAFINNRQLFLAHEKTLKMDDEAEKSEEGQSDYTNMTTTVPFQLNRMAEHFSEYLDVVLQKEMANTEASSDLEVAYRTLGTGLPATFLLGLEAKLGIIRKLLVQIPTHATGVDWEVDTNATFPGVVKMVKPEITNKTRAHIVPFQLSPATKEHPAQVEKLTENITVGKFTKYSWSGMLAATEKAAMVKRLDHLAEEVKKARMRANEQNVTPVKIGEGIMDYILGSAVRNIGLQSDNGDGEED